MIPVNGLIRNFHRFYRLIGQDADVVLVCVGRREYRDGLGTEELGIEMEGKKIKATRRCDQFIMIHPGSRVTVTSGSENP
jgi:hypothetical protein